LNTSDLGIGFQRSVMGIEASTPRSDRAVTPLMWLDRQLDTCEAGTCAVDLLLPGDSPRLNGEVDEHVRLLVESPSPLPAVVVHRPTMRVIDGMHRLRAVKLRGDRQIDVTWFDGDERDAFVVAVRSNVSHGLPLSLDDRRNAATRIIRSHPQWSDRMIASVVGLAPTTVCGIRTRSPGLSALSSARVGRDGRTRPVSTVEGRRLAGELIRENPDTPLREIARATGLAPSTVLDVRNRVRAGRDPIPPRLRDSAGEPANRRPAPKPRPTRPGGYLTTLDNLKKDPSLRYNDVGRMLLRWLQTGPTDQSTRARLVERLPPHCVEQVIGLARRQASAWQELADQLEAAP
jgi:hypothetical protein